MKGKFNLFNAVKLPGVGSNFFDLSHDVKMSFKMGWLTPSCVMDVVPGDKVKISVANMLRFAPLIAPVMHRVNVTTHFFFVPNRILWPEWEQWITGQSDVEAPYVTTEGGIFGTGTLGDYLGYPSDLDNTLVKMSVLPAAAYAKVWDEYYRDQNLQAERFAPLTPGDNTAHYGSIVEDYPFRRAWQHDYFTSALPWAQKGDAVTIPLIQGEAADVVLKSPLPGNAGLVVDASTGSPATSETLGTGTGGELTGSTSGEVVYDPDGTLQVDLNAEASTINTLRRAFKLQEWLERNARGGTRYIENILSHFGVRSSDARLQRPEYIGGAFQKMTISEVLSTAATDRETATNTETPVGYMAGHGISVGSGQEFSYRAEEHGWILGIINVQPVTAYQQGVPRYLSREDPLDYYWPSFANIGEQEVLVKELYTADGMTLEQLNTTFGYVPRYAEYKYIPSRVAGEMKTTLSFWHLGRIFDAIPTLSEQFVECSPSSRIFAITDSNEHEIIAHVFNNVKAVRKMPKFGVPTF